MEGEKNMEKLFENLQKMGKEEFEEDKRQGKPQTGWWRPPLQELLLVSVRTRLGQRLALLSFHFFNTLGSNLPCEWQA